MRLRVIAGTAGGRRLVAPRGRTARPTTDRVKESLFAALGDDRIAGTSVLDLYAGSGALAIEALSRGAARAVLVEQERAAGEAIEQNLAATGLADRARVLRGEVERVLDRPVPTEAPFGLVFLDPPYDTPAATLTAVLERLHRGGWLAPGRGDQQDGGGDQQDGGGDQQDGGGDQQDGGGDKQDGGGDKQKRPTVVIERGSVSERPTLPTPWTITWERWYGDTLLIVATA